MNKIIFKLHFVCFIFISFLINGPAFAQSDEIKRPKIGLVLSGGGARGAAHVGVLKILEENHIAIDMIAGTSFGAIVGGLYAAGYSADQLEDILKNIDWQETLSNSAPRKHRSFRRKADDDGFLIKFKIAFQNGEFNLPNGFITPNNLRLTLGDLINKRVQGDDFDKLAIPFRAVATDLETGEEVVLKEGNLASAIVASMAVPALFPPVELNGKLLVDGGIANNIPINIARSMGADIVIVVDISTPLLKKDQITSFTSVIDQLTSLQSKKASAQQIATLTDQDILIRPDLENIGFVDFENANDAIPKGIEAATNILDQLLKFKLSEDQWNVYYSSRTEVKQQLSVIDFIRVENNSDLSDEAIKSRLSLSEGQKLNTEQLSENLNEIYGLGLFEEVDYNIIKQNGNTELEVRTKQRSEGEDYIRFGLALQENFEGESGFQLAAGFTNLAVNSYGGEWQTLINLGQEFSLFTEFYQPLDFKENFYVFTNAKGSKINRNILSDDNSGTILSQARISLLTLQFGGGLNLGQWGTLRAGLQRSIGYVKGRIGFSADHKIAFDETSFGVEFLVDTLDNINFPTTGNSVEISYVNNLSLLGGDGNVDTVLMGSYTPFTWGKNTLGIRTAFATSFNGNPNETNLFPLGGFMRLTSFSPGQLTGNHGGVLTALFYRRISGGPQYLTQMPIYVGGSIESGNVWNHSEDINFNDLKWSSSLFVGIDTILGPTYLGVGFGSGGSTAVFLNVGQLF